MKKIYALALMAAAALSATAQNGAPLYITGGTDGSDGAAPFGVNDSGEAITWDPANPGEFKYEDGKYTIFCPNLGDFQLSTQKGDWDTWNTGALVCNYGKEPGVAVELVEGTGNISLPWVGSYTVEVAGDLSTLTLYTDDEKPATHVYLKGDMNSWSNDEAWEMTSTEDELYWYFVCEDGQQIQAGEAFKIGDAGWTTINYGSNAEEPVELDAMGIWYYNASVNSILAEDWSGSCLIDLSAGEKEDALVIFCADKDGYLDYLPDNAVKGVEIADETAAPVYFNLQGVQVANPENGIFIVKQGSKVSKIVK